MEHAATAGGSAHAPGMQQLMSLLQQQAAAPPPAPEVVVVSRAGTELAALAGPPGRRQPGRRQRRRGHLAPSIQGVDRLGDGQGREAEPRGGGDVLQLALGEDGQEIAKTRASCRFLLVVALGHLKRMRAVAAALSPGLLRMEQEATIATAEQEVKYLQDQTTALKNMAVARIFADDTWGTAAFFAMVRSR